MLIFAEVELLKLIDARSTLICWLNFLFSMLNKFQENQSYVNWLYYAKIFDMLKLSEIQKPVCNPYAIISFQNLKLNWRFYTYCFYGFRMHFITKKVWFDFIDIWARITDPQ